MFWAAAHWADWVGRTASGSGWCRRAGGSGRCGTACRRALRAALTQGAHAPFWGFLQGRPLGFWGRLCPAGCSRIGLTAAGGGVPHCGGVGLGCLLLAGPRTEGHTVGREPQAVAGSRARSLPVAFLAQDLHRAAADHLHRHLLTRSWSRRLLTGERGSRRGPTGGGAAALVSGGRPPAGLLCKCCVPGFVRGCAEAPPPVPAERPAGMSHSPCWNGVVAVSFDVTNT